MFLKTKEEVKYFLTTISDCIKNKNEDLVYYVPETSREFITNWNYIIKIILGEIYTIININLNIEVQTIRIVE